MKIGLTTGCWDLFHAGHRHLLRLAARECTLLIVAVNHDAWITEHKGPGRPFHPLVTRMAAVRMEGEKLREVDRRHTALFTVIPFNGDDSALANAIHPDIIIRGHDQSVNFSAFPVIRATQLPGVSTTLLASQRSSDERVLRKTDQLSQR